MSYNYFNKQQVVIGWPLTPYTGWGGYGIQLAKTLISQSIAQPIVPFPIEKSDVCDVQWQLWINQIETESQQLMNAVRENKNQKAINTGSNIIFEDIGNFVKGHKFNGQRRVGIAFFERSVIPDELRIFMQHEFDLIITGSKYNQEILESIGIENSILVHQGIDKNLFNSIPDTKMLLRPFVIFAGGKLEIRKGQDIVIEAFKRFMKICPDALLIACWANIENIGINTLNSSPYILSNPASGKARDIQPWLVSEGIPARNIIVPPALIKSQLASLIKQADTAVFMSRCEGGTNLMAMETLACGIPTLLSQNTGHLDLLDGKQPHAIGVTQSTDKMNPKQLSEAYGGDEQNIWGETDPDALVEEWVSQFKKKEYWRANVSEHGSKMTEWCWDKSMGKLMDVLYSHDFLKR